MSGEFGAVAVGRPRRVPRLTAAAAGGLVVLLTGAVIAQAALTRQLSAGSFRAGSVLILAIWVIAAVGLVVAWHQPGNPVGWLLLAAPVGLLLTLASDSYVTAEYRTGQHALPVLGPAALIFAQEFFLFVVALPLVVLFFPDGRLPSARWRWPLWVYLALSLSAPVANLGVTIDVLVRHVIRVLPDGQLAQVENPPAGLHWVVPVFFAGLAVGWLSALCRQVISWRRSTGERRQQLKWLMSGAAIAGLFIGLSIASNASLWEVLMLGVAALPVSIGIGILKYRLYEIDRIISRTLAYAIVTGLLVGVYAGLVLLATRVLPVSSPVGVAGSTLVAVALFTPLRRRVQRVVDRRFNRARYDADRTVEAFAARLQDSVDLGAVHADLVEVVNRSLQPAHVSVWVRGHE